VLAREDFLQYGKPFNVTTELVKAAGVDRHDKAKLLQAFEQWGLIFLKHQGDKKNPCVYLRKLQGRGKNPFQESG
jgi:hypothetical protein